MPPIRALAATAALLLAGLGAAPAPVRAAQSYDNCTGFIDTLPATITTQGTWCLRGDLSTAIASGTAIHIATNNVTIDCNDFKLGGLAAGAGTNAYGIYSFDRLNTTVRHCNIRGFSIGLGFLSNGGGGGHVVEDNRVNGNTYMGLDVEGDGSVVRRNQVSDTGGSTSNTGSAYGILAIYAVDVIDNSVTGVLPTVNGSIGNAFGIQVINNPYGSIIGNRVRGILKIGSGVGYGIVSSDSGRISVERNHVVGPGDYGIYCSSAGGSAKDNIISGFTVAGLSGCTNEHGNVIKS